MSAAHRARRAAPGGDSLTSRVRKFAGELADTVVGAPRVRRAAPVGETLASGVGFGDDRDALVLDGPSEPGGLEARQRGGSGGGRGGRRGGGDKTAGLLSEAELADYEDQYADGVTAAQVVDLFVTRGVRFSEATFRKYVQQGLLPRSRRVGRKGKHRGSLGMYPAKTIRRVNEIKRLMAQNHTIEEIQQSFLRFTDTIESLEEGFEDLFAQFEEELERPELDGSSRREMRRELSDARKTAAELMTRIDGLARRTAQPRGDRYGDTGAAGSAEDLL